jgi:hypothetical protein
MQKPTSPQKHTSARRRRFLIVILILIPTLFILSIVLIRMADRLPLVSVLWSSVQNSFKPNHAEEVAKPIETALEEAGAVKKCSRGDDGRGVSNRAPWYGASYLIPKGKYESVAVVEYVASANGYNLSHATPENRGHLGAVADEFIDKWYFDNESKRSSYSELKDGHINFSFVIYGEGEKEPCNQTIIEPGRSFVGIGINLPEYR